MKTELSTGEARIELAQDIPIYGEQNGKRYQVIGIGLNTVRTICGKNLDLAGFTFDLG